MAIIGPAVGYLIGGEFLKRYTDLYSVDTSRYGILEAVHGLGWFVIRLHGLDCELVPTMDHTLSLELPFAND